MMICQATKAAHCCRHSGRDCEHIIFDYTDEDGNFREVACGLRAELGDWDKVLKDPRYPGDVWAEGVNCRDWPEKPVERGGGCSVCGWGR